MKRVEFVLMALGIPWIHYALLGLAVVAILACCCGCTSEETIDRINNLPSDDAINKRYEHVSKDAPKALKPFYDAKLTEALNR